MDKSLANVSKIFKFAFIYGLIALIPQYFMENKTGMDYPPPITHPEYFYGFIGVALAWQFVFLLISKDPKRYKPIILPALLEKFSFGIACIVLYLQARLNSLMLVAGIIDLILMILFFISYKKIPNLNDN